MATYKAEFLSHYYARRLRPRSAYAMGLIMTWARVASLAPGLANFLAHAPGLARLAKLAGGIAPEREIPRFAPYTFRRWFETRPDEARARYAPRGSVLLFADTFNDHFHPGTAIATVDALEAAGYAVELPRRRVCCGRPLYDFGMLDLARRKLEDLLDVVAPRVAAGVPVVGIEPSCVAVLRDELPDLLADDPRAKQVSDATLMLSELLERDRVPLPRLDGKAVFQGHCHHHAVMGLDAELAVLKRLGLDVARPDGGCCGMAGSFGFQRGEHYAVSVAAGERGILPAVRAAPKDALVLADGFSCREQIAQGTDRRGLHLAEVLALARRGGAAGPYPERRAAGRLPPLPLRARLARVAAQALVVGAIAGAALLWRVRRRA
jgi:Fe-S oxidoreductase